MKRFVLLPLIFALVLTFSGCGEKQPLNKDAVREDILKNVTFEVELEKVGDNAVSVMFTLEDGVTAEIYKGSSVYPDQFGIFTAPDSAKAKATKKMLEEYKQSLLTDYSHYNAEQLSKIEDAVIYTRGNDVVFVICDQNDKAKEIINTH